MYTNPPMRQVQRSPTTTTASGLIGAWPLHQPVLRIQVYIVEWPFSCISTIWTRLGKMTQLIPKYRGGCSFVIWTYLTSHVGIAAGWFRQIFLGKKLFGRYFYWKKTFLQAVKHTFLKVRHQLQANAPSHSRENIPWGCMLTSNKWSRKKWDREPAEISKKHCLLFSGTCNNTKIKQIRHTTLDWYGGFWLWSSWTISATED